MMMKNVFLSNWKGKIASLFLAFAIWYLIDTNLRRPDRLQIPVPGTVSPLPDTSPNSIVPIPGGGSPGNSSGLFPPARIEALLEQRLYGLYWIEEGRFADSVLAFPGEAVS